MLITHRGAVVILGIIPLWPEKRVYPTIPCLPGSTAEIEIHIVYFSCGRCLEIVL